MRVGWPTLAAVCVSVACWSACGNRPVPPEGCLSTSPTLVGPAHGQCLHRLLLVPDFGTSVPLLCTSKASFGHFKGPTPNDAPQGLWLRLVACFHLPTNLAQPIQTASSGSRLRLTPRSLAEGPLFSPIRSRRRRRGLALVGEAPAGDGAATTAELRLHRAQEAPLLPRCAGGASRASSARTGAGLRLLTALPGELGRPDAGVHGAAAARTWTTRLSRVTADHKSICVDC
jgi:hypothetical protein